jgi:uncharacterized protein with HEPN domain
MSPTDLELLRHIYDELKFVLESRNGKEKVEIINDGILSRAVIRSLEIIDFRRFKNFNLILV